MGDATRADILRIVQWRGAIHKSELCRATGQGWGNISHHIDVLHRRELVELDRDPGRLWVHTPNLTEVDKALLRATAPLERQRIVLELSEGDLETITELSRSMMASKKVIRPHTSLDWDHLETPQRAFMRKSEAMRLGAFLTTIEVNLR